MNLNDFECTSSERLEKLLKTFKHVKIAPTRSAFANKGRIDEEHTGEALYEEEWVGFFFWDSGSVIEMARVKRSPVETHRSQLNICQPIDSCMVYLQYIHLVDLYTCGKYM